MFRTMLADRQRHGITLMGPCATALGLLVAWAWAAGAQQQQPISSLDSFSFPVQQPFGSLQLTRAGCCPYAGLPVLPQTREGQQMAFVLGAQKAATTVLYQILTAHPNIVGRKASLSEQAGRLADHKDSNVTSSLDDFFNDKEPHYFNGPPLRAAAYSTLLHYHSGFSHAKPGQMLLDGTPDYLETAWAACRIKAAAPTAKLIVLLRDPVARTFSHWRHLIKAEYWKTTPDFPRGRPDPFDQEVKREINHLIARNCTFRDAASSKRSWNDCFQCNGWHCGRYMQSRDPVDTLCDFQGAGYTGVVLHSLYAPQLAWWLSLFPKEQLHVMGTDYFSGSQDEAMAHTFEFLGVEHVPLSDKVVSSRKEKVSQHRDHSSKPELDPDTYVDALNELYEFYRPLNEQLYALLDSLGVKNFTRFPTAYIRGQGSGD